MSFNDAKSPEIAKLQIAHPEIKVKGIIKSIGAAKKGIKVQLNVPELPELSEIEIKRRKALFKKAQLKDKKPSKEQIQRLSKAEDW